MSTSSIDSMDAQRQQDVLWMKEALLEAQLAAEQQEVPVGCLVVLDGNVIGRAHNQRETLADPTAHAEILALREASQSRGQWRLEGATVYVTLEPCPMCAGALVNARVERVVFGCTDPKAGGCETLYCIGQDTRLNHRFAVTGGICAEESANLLRSFFRARRKKTRLSSSEEK